MPSYEFEGLAPVVDPSAYVHPTAVLIGDVIIESGVYVDPNASLRGDYGRLILQRGSNLQDGCIMHGYCDMDTVVEPDGHVGHVGHVGHGAILHGCLIKRNALVGMNAVVMDGTVIGEDSMVATMSFVKAGFQGRPKQLLMGQPVKMVREVTEQDLHWKGLNTQEYQVLAQRSAKTMQLVTPLTKFEVNRPRLQGVTEVQPKVQRVKVD